MIRERPLGAAGKLVRLGIAIGALALAALAGILVALAAGDYVPGEAESEPVEFLGGFNGWGALAVAILSLLLGWALSGRWLLNPFGNLLRRHRIGLHAWISVAALAMATIHTVGLLARQDSRGWASGAASIGMMCALFVTGWWRTTWVRAWGVSTWRWVHWELALGAIIVGLEHWLIIEHLKGG